MIRCLGVLALLLTLTPLSLAEDASLDASLDGAAWEVAREADTISAYQLYRDAYPDGAYFDAATDRIIALVAEDVAAKEAAKEAAAAEAFRPAWDAYPDQADVLMAQSLEDFLAPHDTDHVIGDRDAPVTVVEFFSFICGHCKRFHEGAYQRVLAEYVAAGKVRVIKREFLLNTNAIGYELTAGAGAQCLESEAQVKALADYMFENQGQFSAGNPIDALTPIFTQLGLDEAQARACMADNRHRNLIFMRSIRAAQTFGVSGTPTLFINGQRYQGNPMDYKALSQALEAAAGG